MLGIGSGNLQIEVAFAGTLLTYQDGPQSIEEMGIFPTQPLASEVVTLLLQLSELGLLSVFHPWILGTKVNKILGDEEIPRPSWNMRFGARAGIVRTTTVGGWNVAFEIPHGIPRLVRCLPTSVAPPSTIVACGAWAFNK